MSLRNTFAVVGMLVWAGSSVLAQSAGLNFDGLNVSANDPVEMTADRLSIDQSTRRTVAEGNVVIGQGDLRMNAQRVSIAYSTTGGIDQIDATGKITFVTENEAAEADTAEYSIKNRTLILRGNVMLTQGQSALLADSMRIDLATGNAQMEGRVRTVLQPNGN